MKKAKEFNLNVITTEKDFVKIPEEFSSEIKFLRVKILKILCLVLSLLEI